MYHFSDDSRISGHLGALGRAEADFEREKAKLYRSDGQPKYTDHEQRLAALQSGVDQAVGAAQQTAEGIIAEQRTLLQVQQEGDPLDHLTTTEQTAAAARKPFVQEDAETLPPAELLARCKTALATTDKATQYLLARYVGRRVRAADKLAADGHPERADLSMEQRQQLGRAVEELLAKVRGPQGEQKTAAAKGLLERAQQLRRRSVEVHDKAHGSSIDRERERLLSTGLYGSRTRG
jgi:hypothetical protein